MDKSVNAVLKYQYTIDSDMLPKLKKGEYLEKLRKISREFYHLLQYMDAELFEELRAYEGGEIVETPEMLVSAKVAGAPQLASKTVHIFLRGTKEREEEHGWTVEDEEALWKNWIS